MKYIPRSKIVAGEYYFCSTVKGGSHAVNMRQWCEECDKSGLTDDTSDHMGTTIGPVLLCLECAAIYKLIVGIKELAGV